MGHWSDSMAAINTPVKLTDCSGCRKLESDLFQLLNVNTTLYNRDKTVGMALIYYITVVLSWQGRESCMYVEQGGSCEVIMRQYS